MVDDPLLQGLSDTDGPWFQARSLVNVIDQVAVRLHIAGTWQDEQTGPRGFTHLWEKASGVPKRLLLANGNRNGTNQSDEMMADRQRWVGPLAPGRGRRLRDDGRAEDLGSPSCSRWRAARQRPPRRDLLPLAGTAGTDWFLGDGGRLSTSPPPARRRRRPTWPAPCAGPGPTRPGPGSGSLHHRRRS